MPSALLSAAMARGNKEGDIVEVRTAETVIHIDGSYGVVARPTKRTRFEGSISHRGGHDVANQGIRASLDKKLDALEHRALALEAQLTQTKDQAMQRLEQRKQQLRDLLKQVQGDVQKSKEMAEQAKIE